MQSASNLERCDWPIALKVERGLIGEQKTHFLPLIHTGPPLSGRNISREGEILRSKGQKSEKFKIRDLLWLEPSVISQNSVIWASGSLVLLKKSPADVARSDNIFDFSLQISPKMPD